MTHPSRVRLTGPLAPYQDTIWFALLECGYAADSARNLLRVAAHLSRWLQERDAGPEDLAAGRIEEFLKHRRSLGYTCWLGPKCLEPILEPMRAQGVVPGPEAPQDPSPLRKVFRDFETYLREDRCLGASTVAAQLVVSRRFLTDLGIDDFAALSRLSTADVSGFMLQLQEARSLSVGTVKLVVGRLRSFLRFLHVHGFCGELAAAVLTPAGHRHAQLPKYFPWEEVCQLVESCDLQTSTGLRDHAILLLLAQLALRAGEVAAMEFGDVHWSGGSLLVRGKGSRDGRMPLPEDVGVALARYLEVGRPSSTSRKIFLKHRAPYGEFGASTVKSIVERACQRAELPRRSAHRFRHTAATRMLRRGASLQAVAEALRHRSVDTTAIYAKVDHKALRSLARPWPGSGA